MSFGMRRVKLSGVFLLVGLTLGGGASAAPAMAPDKGLVEAIGGPVRSDANKARDVYRHPLETLTFFGLQANMVVVEIAPGGGWYTEILVPYLRQNGKYYAAGGDPAAPEPYIQQGVKAFAAKLAARPEIYGGVEVTVLSLPDKVAIAPPGSVDLVLTFRTVHNWLGSGYGEEAFAALFKALKPGGLLGVEEHRARDDMPQDPKAESGYVREDYTIALAEKAGFVLEARAEINANPLDTKDYEQGVWTLPPTYTEGEKNRAKYAAIGESDRFTLRFRRPR